MFLLLLKIVWLLNLLIIPTLSIKGRPLQRYVAETVSDAQLASFFLIVSIVLLGSLVYYLRQKQMAGRWIHLVWGALVFIIIPLLLPTVAERLHFIVFGLFGFFSFRLFGLKKAIWICLVVGLSDEILQWWLPERYGDWRDVGFNWLACLAGILLNRYLRLDHEKDYPVND